MIPRWLADISRFVVTHVAVRPCSGFFRSFSINLSDMSKALLASILTISSTLLIWSYFGLVWMDFVAIVVSVTLILLCGSKKVGVACLRIHTPYILCLLGIVISLIYAVSYARLEEVLFWVSLQTATVVATGVLSLCYWALELLIPDETAKHLTGPKRAFLTLIIGLGAGAFIFSYLLPYMFVGFLAPDDEYKKLTRTSLQPVIIQQMLIIIGAFFHALNSGILFLSHQSLKRNESDRRESFLCERHRAWIQFFCSDLPTIVGFLALASYFCYFLGWDVIIDVFKGSQRGSMKIDPILIQGAGAFFAGAVSLQILFSNGIFYFVNLPWETAKS